MLAKFRSRSAIVIAVLAASVAISGCSLLHKKKKVDDNTAYQEAPVDQLYSAGASKLDARLWSEGIVYFKEVERQHPYSEWSRRAILMQAYAHYEANQYVEAVADANRFAELYPGNPTAARVSFWRRYQRPMVISLPASWSLTMSIFSRASAAYSVCG